MCYVDVIIFDVTVLKKKMMMMMMMMMTCEFRNSEMHTSV